MVYRRRSVLEVGNFSADRSRVCEDVDLSCRLVQAGWKLHLISGLKWNTTTVLIGGTGSIRFFCTEAANQNAFQIPGLSTLAFCFALVFSLAVAFSSSSFFLVSSVDISFDGAQLCRISLLCRAQKPSQRSRVSPASGVGVFCHPLGLRARNAGWHLAAHLGLSDFGWKEPGMSATRWYQKSLKDIGGADDLQSLVEVCQHQGHTGLYINDVSEHDVAHLQSVVSRWSSPLRIMVEIPWCCWSFCDALDPSIEVQLAVNWSPNFEVSHKARSRSAVVRVSLHFASIPKGQSSNNSAIFWIH